MTFIGWLGTALSLFVLSASQPASSAAPPRVIPNDNRTPAGRLEGGVLTLRLEVRLGEWFPQDPSGPSVTVPVFAEEGKTPEIPGPLIRVPAGTMLDITVTNQLADTGITIFGLFERPTVGADSVRLAPSASHRFRFRAGAPGTYQYGARTERQEYRAFETLEETQLAGALIVDAPGARSDDRVFVINIWDKPADTLDGAARPERHALTINGRAWPYTERLAYTVGDSAHWRIVNATRHVHPMHLHGFYYRVTALGGFDADTAYAPEDERLVVTESMLPQSSMAMAFQAREEGNWLFHCHLIYHVNPDANLSWPDGAAPAHDEHLHMGGLVLGLVVAPGPTPAPRLNPATMRVVAREVPRPAGPNGVTMSYSLGTTLADAPVTLPSPVLFLTRGVPTDVTVVNRLDEPTGVHWHGLELESASDGVAGWSRTGDRQFAQIQPGDSFVAHLTQPRAGTFIYHTHFQDEIQLTSGLYGPIVVLEPGAVFQPATDHIFLVGRDGEEGAVLLNGDSLPGQVTWAAGENHRLRLINIMPYGRVTWRLLKGDSVTVWRSVARDGADLPASQQRIGRAASIIDVGETADFELPAAMPGTYRLEVGPRKDPLVTQTIQIGESARPKAAP